MTIPTPSRIDELAQEYLDLDKKVADIAEKASEEQAPWLKERG